MAVSLHVTFDSRMYAGCARRVRALGLRADATLFTCACKARHAPFSRMPQSASNRFAPRVSSSHSMFCGIDAANSRNCSYIASSNTASLFCYRQTGGADGGRGIGCRCILPDSWLRTRPPYQWSVFRVGEIEVLSERADFEFKIENTCVCAAFLRITGLLFLLLLYSLTGLLCVCACIMRVYRSGAWKRDCVFDCVIFSPI